MDLQGALNAAYQTSPRAHLKTTKVASDPPPTAAVTPLGANGILHQVVSAGAIRVVAV